MREIDFWKVATVVLAILGAYIAYRQYTLGREKFKLDLFEKRFAVFAGARKFLTLILRDASVSREHLFDYRASVAEASFLFDEDITEYLRLIDSKALRLHTLEEVMKPPR